MKGQGFMLKATAHACRDYKKLSPDALPFAIKMLKRLAEGRHGQRANRLIEEHFNMGFVLVQKSSHYRMAYTKLGADWVVLGFMTRADSAFFNGEK